MIYKQLYDKKYKNPAAIVKLSEKENNRYLASRFGILEKDVRGRHRREV